jgi:putative hydrolase of the HAD superfamily
VKLDGVVLDLDDTLFDTTGLLLPWADRRAVAAMRAAGLDLAEDAALVRLRELRAAGVVRTFAALAAERGAPAAAVEAGENAWFDYVPPPMALEPAVDRALDELVATAPLALFTMGHVETQKRKVARLGLERRFRDLRFIDFRGPAGKTETLAEILADHGWGPDRVVVCGDRPDADVRAATKNGCRGVLVRRAGGEFAAVPTTGDDAPWRTIGHVAELPGVLRGTVPPWGLSPP